VNRVPRAAKRQTAASPSSAQEAVPLPAREPRRHHSPPNMPHPHAVYHASHRASCLAWTSFV
jgi:hypothetical protein